MDRRYKTSWSSFTYRGYITSEFVFQETNNTILAPIENRFILIRFYKFAKSFLVISITLLFTRRAETNKAVVASFFVYEWIPCNGFQMLQSVRSCRGRTVRWPVWIFRKLCRRLTMCHQKFAAQHSRGGRGSLYKWVVSRFYSQIYQSTVESITFMRGIDAGPIAKEE